MTNWTKEETEQLVSMAGKIPASEIAIKLGRSVYSLVNKLRRMGLSSAIPIEGRAYWTPEELAAFAKDVPYLTALQFQQKYSMRKDLAYSVARKLRMNFSPTFYWTKAQEEIIAHGGTCKEIMAATGRNRRAVEFKAKRMGIVLTKEARKGVSIKQVPKNNRIVVNTRLHRIEPKRLASSLSSGIEWCPTCHSPVSNWQEHYERLGHRRPA